MNNFLTKNLLIEFIRISFATGSLMFVAPALLPGIEYNGSIMLAFVLGLVFYGYQRLWMHFSHRLMGIERGSCPMPKAMKWMLLSTISSIILFVAALGIVTPAVYTVHGIFSAIMCGMVVLVGMMLSNFITVPLSKDFE